LVLAVTVYAFDGLSITAAMPKIVEDLGGVSLYGAAFSTFTLAMLFSLSIAGSIADRRGPRPVLAIGLTLFVIGLAIGGLAPTMPIVVLGRLLQGLAGGTIGACAYVVIGRAFPEVKRPQMFALLSAAWIVPGLVAPGAAGAIAEHLTWRLVFLGLLPFPIIAAVLALPPLHRLGAAAPELVGDGVVAKRAAVALQLTVGVALLLVGLDQRNLLAAAALVVGGGAVALPALLRLLPTGTLRAVPVLPAIIAARLLANWAFFGTDAFIPLALTSVRGKSALFAGLTLTSASLSWSTAAWVQSRLSKPGRDAALIGSGMAIVGLGIAIVATTLWTSVPVVVTFIGWAIAGVGMGFTFNTASVAALREARPGEEGATSSSLQLADALGVSLSTGLGGAVIAISDRHGWDHASTLAIVFAITGVAVIPGLLAARRLRSASPAAAPAAA
jgi:MFS family permease